MPTTLKAAGLYTSPNALSTVPEGALSIADNVVIRHANVLEARRGFETYTTSAFANAVNELFVFNGTLLTQYNSNTLARDNNLGMFTNYTGSFSAPDPTTLRMKAVESTQSFFFTTSTGIYALDSVGGTPTRAGIQKALPPIQIGGNLPNSTGSWMNTNAQVGYRLVYGYRDANNRIILGAPSGRVVFTNPADIIVTPGNLNSNNNIVTATAANSYIGATTGWTTLLWSTSGNDATFGTQTNTSITLGITTPTSFSFNFAVGNGANSVNSTFSTGLQLPQITAPQTPNINTATYFVRLYRTLQSVSATTDPGDEHFLAFEAPVSTVINGSSIIITDTTPEAFLGEPLYTNPNTGEGGGILVANEQPPIAKDITLWQERIWYANTTSKQRLQLQLLGVGSPNGLQNNDTITIGPQTYIARTTGSVSPTFLITTNSTPAGNIYATALALVQVINNNANSPVSAYYISGPGDAPGKILLEEKNAGAAAITVSASRPLSWFPALNNGVQTDNNRLKNGLFYSKYQQPDAVPLTNFITVGSRNRDILRVTPLLDRLFVFKDQEGVFTVSGQPPFRVDLLDNTARLISPDSVKVLGNQIYALTGQGVVTVNPSGVGVVSRAIERDLLGLIATAATPVKQVSTGVAYESDRTYLLFLPTVNTDTVATQAYAYNYFTNTWSHYTRGATSGLVNPANDTLYLGTTTGNNISYERKNYNATDYSDESFAVNITAATGTSVTVSTAVGVNAGDLLLQGASQAIVVSIASNVLTVSSTQTWSNGAATVFPSYPCNVSYQVQTHNAPEVLKHARQITYHLRASQFTLGTLSFASELNTATQSVTNAQAGFGYPQFGSFAFGNPTQFFNLRLNLPIESQYGAYFTLSFSVREARSTWQLLGYSLTAEGVSERNAQ